MVSSALQKFVTVAAKSSAKLSEQISSNQGPLDGTSGLRKVLKDHDKTLDKLIKLSNIGTQLDILKTPLLRCASVCTDMLSYYTQHDAQLQNVQHANNAWNSMIHKINGMQYLLAAYSSTIAVVVAYTNHNRHALSPTIERVQSSSDSVKSSSERSDDYQILFQNAIIDLEEEIRLINQPRPTDETNDVAKSLEEERLSLETCLKLVKFHMRNERGQTFLELPSTITTEIISMDEGVPHVDNRWATPPDGMYYTNFFDNTAFGLGHVQIAVSSKGAKVGIKNTALGSNNLQLGSHVNDTMLQHISSTVRSKGINE